MEWTTSCLDWESRIVKQDSLIVSPPLYQSVANEAWDICSHICMTDVAGQPLLGDIARPWLRDFVKAVFGAEDPDSGRRHINEFLLMVSKKNGKSSIAAAIMLCALLMNWRQSAELLILSPTKEIADNSFKPIKDAINADEYLSGLLKIQPSWRTITHTETGATLKVVAADDDTVSGKKASFVFVDELHEFGKKPKASNMLLEATGGLSSRPEGFVIYATTQSAEPPSGVFKTKLDYARRVRDGQVIDKKFLPVIYEFPPAMLESKAYEDLGNAYVTNPNWGASVDVERITQLYNQFKESGEQGYKEFLAKHLNVEIGTNLRANRWVGADYWDRQADANLTLYEVIQRSEVITIGIDGGGLDDLFGLCVLGRCAKTKNWLAWTHAWCHEGVLERRKSIASRLRDFEADGDLTIVSDSLQDISAIVEVISTVKDSGKLANVGVDPAGLGEFTDALADIGVTQEAKLLSGIPQGYGMMNAIKTAERKLTNGTLQHAGQKMMAWVVGNLKIEPTATAIRATKQNAGDAKIDPAMALFDAAYAMASNPEAANVIGEDYELKVW